MNKVVWGVLGTADIARKIIIPAMRGSGLAEVRAIASRDIERARITANQLDIPFAYGSYDDLIADPEIEAIYNPLPNHLHVPFTLAAAKAGKHVLCEKPLSLRAADLDALAEVSDRVHIMEALMVRHSLQWRAARELLRERTIGRIFAVQTIFAYNNVDPTDIRNRLDTGGGSLLDIGCYAVAAGRFFFEAEPLRVVSIIEHDEKFGTDILTSALLDFGQGRHLTMTVATQLARCQKLTVLGSTGHLSLPIPFGPPDDIATEIITDNGVDFLGSGRSVLRLAPSSQHQEMIETFCRIVRCETEPVYGLADARSNMRALDALFESCNAQGWATV